MEEQTCPNCNVDIDPTELKQNHLRCPTCGYDMSEAGEDEREEDWEEEEEAEDFEEEEGEEDDAEEEEDPQPKA